ncbi:hypothetical protein M408DRAFT_62316 [Serendipita vermifera MAFF 305830]|uniref:L-serine ammonia-lyase n=1 Tax=Serendipita vermifera MAFF 305830 TaxID=933852 RepID=A0A0C2XV99_SERVB|nr:hypothetical protein M408DRAFT_62316 [Serendipita vermifera MAFF 305830]
MESNRRQVKPDQSASTLWASPRRPSNSPSSNDSIQRPTLSRGIASGIEHKASETKEDKPRPEHAVISTFDLFSVGVGPSSSHTLGPWRAGRIYVHSLKKFNILERVASIKITLYGSLAATGRGHHTPQAILLGLEDADPVTVDTATVQPRYDFIRERKILNLGGAHRINFDIERDMLWRMEQLPTHPNGMRFSVFDSNGDLLATNEYYSVGGGFVVNEETKLDENLYYMGIDKDKVDPSRRSQTHGLDEATDNPSSTGASQPPYLFKSGDTLLAMTQKHNMTIAQLVYDNELHYLSEEQIHTKLMRIWEVMDECIRTGVSTTEKVLPGRLGLRRRAPMLYQRLMRGFYPGLANSSLPAIGPGNSALTGVINAPDVEAEVAKLTQQPELNGKGPTSFQKSKAARAPRVVGSFAHPVLPMPPKRTVFPNIDFLSCYAIAVNEVNAAGGRMVTSPTNGAAGVIPAVLKYTVEFISDDVEKTVETFLLTAAAIGMLFKRGSTISAAEGGCQAEVGVACSMAAGAFAACLGAPPAVVLQSAEVRFNRIEHNLGLTCDPIDGLVQVPCIERNALGAVKAMTAAQLAMATDALHSVSLDEAIEAMRLTAADMSIKYKETSLSGLATTVKIPLTSPAW